MTPVIPLTRPPVRLAAPGTFPLPGMPGCTYTIGREAVLDYDLSTIPQRVAVDIEGAGAEGRKKYDVKSVQIADERHALVADPRDPAQYQVIRRVLNSGRTLVFHNSPFDVPIVYLIGLMDRETCWSVEDTLIWCRGANPSEFGGNKLSQATAKYLGMSGEDHLPSLLKTLGISTNTWYEDFDLNTPAYRQMAASDAIATARLRDPARQAHYDRLTKGHPFGARGVSGEEAWRLVDREQVMNRIHLYRQCPGYLVDPDYLDRYRAGVGRELDQMAREIEAAGVTPGDSASLVRVLDKDGFLPENYPRTAKTGQPSGAKGNLEKLGHPLVKTFLKHKNLVHIDKDYLAKVMDAADPVGRIHPGTSMLKAATGRMAIGGDAPLQQFTGAARGIILADNWEEAERHRTHEILDDDGEVVPCDCPSPKGLVSIDWSQIEPVVIANVAGDHAALSYYESGQKFYDAITNAASRPITYKQSKIVLLAQLYGEGMGKLAADLGISIKEAAELRDAVWEALPGVKSWASGWDRELGRQGKLREIAEKHELMITVSGRVIPVPAGMWPCRFCDGVGCADPEGDPATGPCWKCKGKGVHWQVSTHKGVNYFVQGSAYDVLAETEIAIHEAGLSDAIYLAVHDELVVDADARHEIRKIMETPPERLCRWAGRTPVLRTDMAHMAGRWYSV
jgi:DNA polymerase-1